MQNVHANYNQTLTKVIDSAQAGYAPKGLPDRIPLQAQSQNLTLSVLSTTNNQILLEENISGNRLLLDKNALQIASTSLLARGDKLVLVSSNSKYATFIVEKNVQQNQSTLKGQTLQNVSNTLSLQWPDIPNSTIKKAQPIILNQVQIAVNSQQALSLANSIIAIAGKNGQPVLAINTKANASFLDSSQNPISANDARAAALRLNIDIGNKQTMAVTIDLINKLSPAVIAELKTNLLPKPSLMLSVDMNSNTRLFSKISGMGERSMNLSVVALKEINSALTSQFQSIKKGLSPLVLSMQSSNLQTGIAIAPNERNLQDLGPAIKQQITEGISKQVLQNARILLAQNPQSNKQIQVSLIDKPLSVSILNSQLSAAKINELGAISPQGKNTNTDASIFIRSGAISALGDSATKPNSYLLNTSKTADILGTRPNNTTPNLGVSSSKESDSAQAADQPSKLLQNKLIDVLRQQSNSENAIAVKVANIKSLIYTNMNQVLPRAESMGNGLFSVLSQLQGMEKSAGPELKKLLTQFTLQIKSYLPSTEALVGKIPPVFDDIFEEMALSPESRQIKDIFTSATLPNVTGVPIQGIGGVNGQSGLVNGLVTMLQASLQAKLLAQQPMLLGALLQSPMFAQLIPKMAGFSKSSWSSSKLLQDLHKLDPNSKLIGELNKVLSNHSLHKLLGSESTLQNQDSFYYTLPNMFSPQHKDIEIVIKREHQAKQEEDKKVQQAWQLSMKLDIGDSGEVLAKVKLMNKNIDLNLYASNQALKDKILTYLPLLNSRLDGLGFVVKPQCYLGKIPNTLHKSDYQVVQTYV